MDNKELKRIYRIEVLGLEAATSKVQQLNQELELQKQIKKEAQKILLANPGDAAAIERQTKVIAESEIAIKKLSSEKKIATKEAEALIVAQEREALAEMKAGETAQAAAGSYKALYAESKRLNELYRSTSPTSPLFDKIKTDAIAAQKSVYDFNRTLSSEGTLVGEYSRGIINAFKSADLGDILRGQVRKGNDELQKLNTTFEQLKKEFEEAKTIGSSSLDAIEKRLIDNRKEAIQLETQLGEIKTELKGVGTIGSQVGQSLKSSFEGALRTTTQLIAGYIGVNAAIGGIQSGIGIAKELSDQTTNLEIELGKTAGGADKLTAALQKIDTRTKLTGLEEIANVATKAGTAEKNLLAVTEAIDKTKVAFGKDFGDLETGTETFAKLINIFYDDREITGDRIEKIGNSIRALANETVASVPFINDFNGRMAGLRQTFKSFELSQSIGLGAAFEEFKQSAEVSSTALVKILPKLASDTEKYSKVLGITNDQFKKLINENPIEVLISVAEKLVKSGKGVEDISTAFADAELGAGRISTILGTIGGKADVFRERIKRAGETIKETTSLNEAFAAKNTNMAATLDKVNKAFADAANSKGFQTTIKLTGEAILFLIKNIPLLLTLGALMLAGWVAQNIQLAILNGRVILYNLAIRGLQLVQGTLVVLNTAYSISMGILTGAYGLATGAAQLFNRVISATPLGLLLTVVALLGASFVALGSAVNGTTESLKRKAIQDKLNAEIDQKVNEQTGEQIGKMKSLFAVINDNSASLDVRKRALEEAKAAGGKYLEGLTLENAATAEGTKLLNSYIESLKLKAAYEAASAIQAEKIKRDLQLGLLEGKLQARLSNNKDTSLEDLTDEEKKFVGEARKQFNFTASVTDLFTGGSAAKEALAFIQNDRANLAIEIDETTNLVKEKYKALGTTIATGPSVTASDTGGKAETEEERKKRLAAAKQAREDLLNELQAAYNNQKVLLETQFQQKKITEEKYLRDLSDLTQRYLQRRINILNEGNTKERRQATEANLEKIKDVIETNKKLEELNKKNYEAAAKLLVQRYEAQKGLLNDQLNTALENPDNNREQKARAQATANKQLLQLQAEFTTASLLLENAYHIKSLENEKGWINALKEARKKGKDDLLKIEREKLQDIKDTGETQLAEFKANIAARRLAILADEATTAEEKKAALEKLSKEETFGGVARELAILNIQFPIIKKLFEDGKITAKEYYDFLAARDAKAAENYKNVTTEIGNSFAQRLKYYKSVKDLVAGEILNAIGKDKTKDGSFDYINEGVSQAYDLAKDAMNSYFDGERQRIEESKNLSIQKLDLEKNQRLARAQSKAEEDSINKQYFLKTQQIEREAFEQQKKLKKSEARVALATELANIAVQASSNPSNATTFGGAGILQFALLGGLAIARYALRVGEINREKYARGGWLGNGGEISGPSHANGGVEFNVAEAEGNELAIINKNSALSNRRLSVTGTPKQIASAINEFGGGTRFAGGASVRKLEYGGSFGVQYSAPQNLSYLNSGGNNNEGMAKYYMKMQESIDATNARIDRIKVNVLAKEVQDTNNKTNKAAEVGTLAA